MANSASTFPKTRRHSSGPVRRRTHKAANTHERPAFIRCVRHGSDLRRPRRKAGVTATTPGCSADPAPINRRHSGHRWHRRNSRHPALTRAVRSHPAQGWGESSGWATPPIGWNYVEGIRASELVPSRKIPPGRGWRRLIYNATGGLVNLGQSPDELQQAHLEARICTLLCGQYKIGVLGKGGVGKTTVAACVGSIFAELRQDDRVVAIDADTAFGELGARVDPHAVGSYWDLAADEHLDNVADVRSQVGNNDAGLFVLAGEASTARRHVSEVVPGLVELEVAVPRLRPAVW